MKEIPFEYQLDPGIDEPFAIPEDNVGLRDTIFTRAQSFGVSVKCPYKVVAYPTYAVIIHGTVETQLKPKNGVFIIPLGFQLRIPPEVALYHRSIFPNHALDFIVDRSDKPKQNSYRVNLYLKVPEASGVIIERDTPVLKIMPLVDTDYNFHYRKKT